jgi:hypothetical protein
MSTKVISYEGRKFCWKDILEFNLQDGIIKILLELDNRVLMVVICPV